MGVASGLLIFLLLSVLPAAGAQPAQIGVFRPDSGQWFLDFNSSWSWDGCDSDGCSTPFGLVGDLPVVADWNNDGRLEIGLFRPADARWYFDLNGNRAWDGCVDDGCSGPFGLAGDLPAVADWNGDGSPNIGVFRPSSGQWLTDRNGNQSWDGCLVDGCWGPFGGSSDIPAVGDWNGDGAAEIGVFRASTGRWFFDLNGNRAWDGCSLDGCTQTFGSSGDLPAAADWNGDGLPEMGVFRPSSGEWFFDLNGNLAWDGCVADACVASFGSSSDLPAAGTWWPSIALATVATGLTEPVQVTHAGDGSNRLFVVERGGVVRILQNGNLLTEPLLDVTGQVNSSGGEQGFLSLAFPPGFAEKQYFYASYTGQAGVGDSVLSRISMTNDPNLANPATEEILLEIVQPFANHNGGQLAFGPDGMLYFALGDGGGSGDPQNNAQDLNTFLGKILRLDVETGTGPYQVPVSNPFGNEIWAYGLRNPWRFAFDRQTGELYIADVGEAAAEEINLQSAASPGGENYGWNIVEGTTCFNAVDCNMDGLTMPVTTYPHTDGNCSVTGGYVYRGSNFPGLQGIYLFADYCSGRVWGMRKTGSTWEIRLLLDEAFLISSFGEDEAGNIYLTDYGNGVLYQVIPLNP